MRRLGTLTAIVVLIVALGGGQAIAGTVHCVPDTKVDKSCGDGHATIQLAVDDAVAADTVLVGKGTYGNVDIPGGKDDLVLKAASTPIIDCGGGSTDAPPVGNGITIGSNGVTIDGFEIRNCDNGIESVGSRSGLLIKNNDIHDSRNPAGGFQGVGILILGAGNNVGNKIVKNKVHDNDRQGIFLGRGCSGGPHDSTNNTISFNEIFNNGLDLTASPDVGRGPDASQYGIQLCEADHNAISHNKIREHNTWRFGIGIYLFDSAGNLVSHNKLKNNRQGIVLFAGGLGGSKNNVIVRNKIKKGINPTPVPGDVGFSFPATGIRIFDAISDGNTIADNKIKKNAGAGVDVISENLLADNISKENGLGGYVIRGSDNLITNNKAKRNTGDGFEATAASATNTFTNNKSKRNTGFGYVDDGTGNVFIENKCKNNAAGGSDPTGLCTPQT